MARWLRASAPGLYLDGGELGEILLPGRYIPSDLRPKDKIDVFVYRDSEDRLVATTEIPHVSVALTDQIVKALEQSGGLHNEWTTALGPSIAS